MLTMLHYSDTFISCSYLCRFSRDFMQCLKAVFGPRALSLDSVLFRTSSQPACLVWLLFPDFFPCHPASTICSLCYGMSWTRPSILLWEPCFIRPASFLSIQGKENFSAHELTSAFRLPLHFIVPLMIRSWLLTVISWTRVGGSLVRFSRFGRHALLAVHAVFPFRLSWGGSPLRRWNHTTGGTPFAIVKFGEFLTIYDMFTKKMAF